MSLIKTNIGRTALAITVAVTAVTLPALLGQSPAVGGLSSSYVFDAGSASVRRVIGFVGSAFLADPVLTGMRFAAVAPNGSTAVVVWDDRVEWVSDLGKYPLSSQAVAGSLASPDQIFWDRKSAAVVVFSSTERQVQFIRVEAGAPLIQNASMPDLCTGAIQLLAGDAANASGALRCATTQDGTQTASLFFLQAGSIARQIQTVDSAVSATFDQNGALYIAGAQSTISRVSSPAVDTNAELLFTEADASSGAVALLVQNTDKLIYTADSLQQRIRVYNLESFEKADDLPLDWQPTQFQQFSSNSFLMNTRVKSNEPLVLFQTGPKRSILFVPAGE